MPGRDLTVCQLLLTLNVGGAEVLAARLARRLAGRYRFVFACLEEMGTLGAQLRDEGFPVAVLGKRPGIDWRAARRLRALVRRERVGLVHAHQYAPFFYAATARLGSSRPRLLLMEHGRAFPDPPRRSHILLNRHLLRRRDRVVGVGEAVRRALVENEGFPAGRVEVIYNGIDLAAFADAARHRDEVRRELGLGPGDFVLLMAARLDPIKDHATAIRAVGRAAAARGGVRLLVVGEGPAAAAIDEQVAREGLASSVRRLGLRRDVPRLAGAADAAILTSLSEGIPLALIEGMAAGLPAVATRVGGVPEVVEDGRTGLLAPPGDVEALAGAILRLAGDPALRDRLGRAGRERAEAAFSEEQMVARYERIYREAAGQGA